MACTFEKDRLWARLKKKKYVLGAGTHSMIGQESDGYALSTFLGEFMKILFLS